MAISRRNFLKISCAGAFSYLCSPLSEKTYASPNSSELFGEKGSRVLRSVRKLSEKGFMVSTTDVYDEVFVMEPGTSKARTFRLEGDYLDLLVLPSQVMAIRELTYSHIKRNL